jgi:Uma2 family endonuclease
MKPAPRRTPPASTAAVPPLRPGERLTQAEFHRRYQAYPEDVKAELIGGIVYTASPLGRPHGQFHPELSGVFWLYKGMTPGVEVLDNTTTILGEAGEPQLDLELRILREHGGQSRESEDNYVEGAPELVAEIADSSRSLDLGGKRNDYEQAGVAEYLVLSVDPLGLYWFDFRAQRDIVPNRRGIAKSRVFPGLWLDVPALLALDSARLVAAVQRGLSSREHTAFVKRLARARHGP